MQARIRLNQPRQEQVEFNPTQWIQIEDLKSARPGQGGEVSSSALPPDPWKSSHVAAAHSFCHQGGCSPAQLGVVGMGSLGSQQNEKEAHRFWQLQVLQLHSLLQSHKAQDSLLQKVSTACGRHQVVKPGLWDSGGGCPGPEAQQSVEGKGSYPLGPVWFLNLGESSESQMVRILLGPPLPVGRKVCKGVLRSH